MDVFKKIFFKWQGKYNQWIDSLYDQEYLLPDIPMATNASHSNFLDYLISNGDKEGFRILEIGSREVCGESKARSLFSKAEYIGFDIYEGANVDIVGDIHKLSTYFNQPFDIIYSHAVFEHLAMPWIAAEEIAKCLKVGGIVCVMTHFSHSSHERPWHFYQYSDMGLKVLFSSALGFECIDAGVSNPIVGRFSSLAEPYLRFAPLKGLYCHSGYIGKKIKSVDSFDWRSVKMEDVVGNTSYPRP